VVRAMALGEVTLRDWWRVVRREFASGLALGGLLGTIGFLRIVVWQMISPLYGEHYLRVAFTVAGSLVGVVLFGSMAGSLLPFLFRRLGVDPASASAPFVATLVDVSGLIIYFTIADLILGGTLLCLTSFACGPLRAPAALAGLAPGGLRSAAHDSKVTGRRDDLLAEGHQRCDVVGVGQVEDRLVDADRGELATDLDQVGGRLLARSEPRGAERGLLDRAEVALL